MIQFIQELMVTPFSIVSLEKTSTKTPNPVYIKPHEERFRSTILMPSNEDVLQYITSKLDFKHTTFDVQEHFYGQQFSSRGKTQSMYLRTIKQLKDVRKEIEKRFGGKFEEIRGKKRLTYYTFKKEIQVVELA